MHVHFWLREGNCCKPKLALSTCNPAWISVLVDGSPTEDFQMRKGVRQGDPLSPFLFIIAAEGLNWLFKIAQNQGFFRSLEMVFVCFVCCVLACQLVVFAIV